MVLFRAMGALRRVVPLEQPADEDAQVIGELYQKARASVVETVEYLRQCGEALISKKRSLPHGEWLPWLNVNADTLGFAHRSTANRLMDLASNVAPAQHLSETKAAKLLRDIWGHDKTPGELLVASNENEWYTPTKYIEAARVTLGVIDLDPASCDAANRTVKAARFFSKADDGLKQPWRGRVWLNPPYGGLACDFIPRVVGEYKAGHVTAAIALVNSHCTDTEWFQVLWEHLLCFTDHRVEFESAGREKANGSTHGSVFAYLGDSPRLFAEHFAQFGRIVTAYRW